VSLFGSAWAQLGAVGVVFFFVILLATGRLVPVSTLRRELDAAITRAEDWKEAHALERKAREIQAAKDDEILNLLRTLTSAPREPAA
jgi:hypothetical protein